MVRAAIIQNITNKPLSPKDSKLYFGDLEGEQLDVLQYPIEKDLLVSGPAGSGKTLLALKRYNLLIEKGFVGEILIYTNILKDYISQKFCEQKEGIKAKSIFKYVIEKCRITPNNMLNGDGKWRDVAEQAARFANIHQNTLDFLIVDEAQDLFAALLDFCSLYARVLNLFADDAQQLYKHGNCTTVILGKLLKEHNRNIKRLDIKGNYRNHITVSNFANPFYNKRAGEPFEGNKKDTRPIKKISIFVSENLNLLNTALIRQVENFIIDPTSASTPKLGILVQDNVASAANMFNNKYQTASTGNGFYNGVNIFETPEPVILTMHSAKGLEFEYVILVNLDYPRLKNKFSDNYNQMLFTAITRARYSLSIFILDNQTEFLELIKNNVEEKYYEII